MTIRAELKYRIKELYNTLPAADKIKIMKEDAERMGISMQHLRQIWNYRHGDNKEAKPSQLLIISKRFNVSIESILNYKNGSHP